ncbi:MAG TPA: ribose-5-phosphate isomerase RpiA [Steroidobacteraceae bacterium]|jgi:ribose 5-phosphate isomerase A|nr:ribose-5-phosphate isomerase RpiA [Steroidobacteraceae bacterium]
MSDTTQNKKRQAARAAIGYLQDGMILGVGTGSTVDALLELLATQGAAARLRGAVSSSERTSERLRAAGVAVLDLNEVAGLPLYIDGADEATRTRNLIKGGGGALTREKIVAAAADRFICIIDEGKLVDALGRFPLPIEVIPMARRQVERRVAALGGRALWRQGMTTDNGNHILDVHDLPIPDPVQMEAALNQIAGVVTVGLFAARPADLLLVGTAGGVETI